MKLPRPHVPWSTRRVVIERQMGEAGLPLDLAEKYTGSDERATRWMIERLFPGQRVELHHRPALCNRATSCLTCGQYAGGDCCGAMPVTYTPDANDPDFLVYLVAGAGEEHDVETRVRGQHGQHSDLALRRKRKQIEKKERQWGIEWDGGKGEARAAREAEKRQKYCRHPFEKLLEIRGSVMCAVCHKEVDRYGSPLHEALKAWHEKRRKKRTKQTEGFLEVIPRWMWDKRVSPMTPPGKRRWPKRKLRSRNNLRRAP